MAHVTVAVNGRSYKMGCRDGEEGRIAELAAEIDAHVRHIKGSAKAVPDDRLFLMAAILLADQLWEARDDLQGALKQMADFRSYQVIDGGNYVAQRDFVRLAEASSAKIDGLNARSGSS